MHLVLMRSGDCCALGEGSRDSERCLTEQGVKEVTASAMFLASIGIMPKAILSSPFKRTTQTAEIISKHMPNNSPVIIAPYIMPGAGAEEFMRSVAARTECKDNDWVIAVGHEPDLGTTVREILGLENGLGIPLMPSTVIGINAKCHEGKLYGRIIFLFSQYGMNELSF